MRDTALTKLGQPVAHVLHGGVHSGLVVGEGDPTPRVEYIRGIDRLQLDLGTQLLQHPKEIQHEAICRNQPIICL